jgi:hypothetical protein
MADAGKGISMRIMRHPVPVIANLVIPAFQAV